MRLKLIACSIFTRELSLLLVDAPHTIDPEFYPVGFHRNSSTLRELLQVRIDAATQAEHSYDAVLLGYGLCGNATVGLKARSVPLVIPRAHDCSTVLLGSRERFAALFGSCPSTPFCSAGYLERGGTSFLHEHTGESGMSYEELVKVYGEENARDLFEALQPKRTAGQSSCALFIRFDHDPPGCYDDFRERSDAAGITSSETWGDLRLLRGLLQGNWDDREYLVVKPGMQVAGVYDWDRVVEQAPA